MPKRRFAVALLIPPPVSYEVDGLRKALGDDQLGKIEPHITLIPPINLRDEELEDALVVIAGVAASTPVLPVTLGPLTTFGPKSRVRYLAVDPADEVAALAEACRTGPLERPVKREFVPHLTVDISGGTADGHDPAISLLAGYEAPVVLDRVSVLEHLNDENGRRWETYLSYRLMGGGTT